MKTALGHASTAMVCGCALLATASAAQGYLGSFTPNDGYLLGPTWSDVSYYNAGQHGPNAGGGAFTNVAPNSGLWKLMSAAGAFYPNAASRNTDVGTAPPYPGAATPNSTVPVYLVGNHFSGRGFDGSNLAFRNDSTVGSGPAIYEYSIDTFDTGGPIPGSITTGIVTTQFYFCPNPADPPVGPGGHPLDKFRMSWKDSAGNLGLEWGYTRDNQVQWRKNASDAWNPTGIVADQADWDGLKVDIDLTNDTFQMDYFDVSASTWSTIVPAGTTLGAAMNNHTTLRWQLEDGVNSGVGGKNFFDDFSFAIPAPSAAVMGLPVMLMAMRRRR